MGVAQHVDQRTLAYHRAEQLWALRHHGRNQKSAIGCADNAKLLRRGKSATADVGGHGLEVVIDALAMIFEARLMPRGAELVAAADIGDRDRAAPGEPRLTGRERSVTVVPVPGRKRQLEAAIAVEDRRDRAFDILRADQEIGNLGAVFRRHPILVGGKPARIEAGDFRLDRARRGFAVIGIKRRRGEEALEGKSGFRAPVVRRCDRRRAAIWQRELCVAPCAVRKAEGVDGAFHVFVDRSINRIAAGCDAVDHGMRAGRQQHRDRRRLSPLRVIQNRKSNQRALCDLLAARRRPCVLQSRDQHTAGDAPQFCADRQR